MEISYYFLFLLIIISFFTIWHLWKKGYYSLADQICEPKNASFIQTIGAGVLFISPSFFAHKAMMYFSEHGSSLHMSILSTCVGVIIPVFLILGFSKITIFKDRTLFSLKEFLRGMGTFLIAYPQIFMILVIGSFVIQYFELPADGQSTINTMIEVKPSATYSMIWIFTLSVLAPVLEEISFRGFLQTFFKKIFTKVGALVITSIIFALFHYTEAQGAANFVFLPGLFIFSIYLGLLYEKTGSISAPLGLHMTFNLINLLITLNT